MDNQFANQLITDTMNQLRQVHNEQRIREIERMETRVTYFASYNGWPKAVIVNGTPEGIYNTLRVWRLAGYKVERITNTTEDITEQLDQTLQSELPIIIGD